MPGLGVDLHPFYQRGVTALPGVEYGWLKMADGARRYTKTVDGVTYRADTHAALFRRLGIPFGGYVYAQPGDGAAEAATLWDECTRLDGTTVAPACDIESDKNIHVWSVAEATDHGRAFCAWYRARGIRPAIYMNDSLAGDTKPDDWPEDPVLWIARYGAKPVRTRFDVHQYSSTGSLPGSAGAVDWNQQYSTAHLLSNEGGLVVTKEEIDAIATATVDAWMDRAVSVDSTPVRYLPASAFLTYTNSDTAALRAMVTQLLGRTEGATADEIAAKLLPALTSALTSAVAGLDVSGLDKLSDDDVQRVVDATLHGAGEALQGGGK